MGLFLISFLADTGVIEEEVVLCCPVCMYWKIFALPFIDLNWVILELIPHEFCLN